MSAALITYFTMVVFLPKPLPLAPVNPSASSRGVTPAPMEFHLPSKSSIPEPVNPPTPSQQITPAPISREAIQEIQDETNRKGQKPPTPSEKKITVESKPTATTVDEKKVKPNMMREEAEVTPPSVKKSPEQTTPGIPANPPPLKLSAIVWFEDPSMRFAMVNGVKAIEGTIVEGVKVVEIHPTRVRFLHNDLSFEIPLGVTYPYKTGEK